MAIISFGVLGFGRHTEKIISSFSRCGQGRIAAIGTSSPEKKSSSQIQRSSIELCSYDKLLELPGIDAIYISLPNHLHEKWIIRALEAGKHVICEKPLCMEKDELSRITDCLKSTKLFFHLGFMYRFHPQHSWVKRFLAEGKLGTPYLFEAHFHYSLLDRENIRFKRETGGWLARCGLLLVRLCRIFISKLSPKILWPLASRSRSTSRRERASSSGVRESAYRPPKLWDESSPGEQLQYFRQRRNSYRAKCISRRTEPKDDHRMDKTRRLLRARAVFGNRPECTSV